MTERAKELRETLKTEAANAAEQRVRTLLELSSAETLADLLLQFIEEAVGPTSADERVRKLALAEAAKRIRAG